MNPKTHYDNRIIRLKPYQYIHILDNNIGVTKLEVGPATIALKEHETLVLEPTKMIIIPPRHYCVIQNPAVKDENGNAIIDQFGQVKLKHGDNEIRFSKVDPFPLYPGEELFGNVSKLRVVESNTALKLVAIRDFRDFSKSKDEYSERKAGDEWLFEGPGTYIPRVEVNVLETVKAIIIKPNEALLIRARNSCIDYRNNKRKAGEEWLIRDEGAYLPQIEEEVIDVLQAFVLTEKVALHLRAVKTFIDRFKQKRKAGDEWLVRINDTETHIPDVYEEVVDEVEITTLGDREWCIIENPIGIDGKNQYGKREVRKGRLNFFLHPGEIIIGGIQKVFVLSELEALLVKSNEAFNDGNINRNPGDLWMIHGPCDYIPPVEVELVERRKAIPLDKNEGIYVRDIKNGQLTLIRGPKSYMLNPYEALWEKELSQIIEDLLEKKHNPYAQRGSYLDKSQQKETKYKRVKSKAVTFHVPQNAACQIHDYKERKARIVFGPDLVMLGPDEDFTVLSLSGDKPKRPNLIKTIALILGPDFMTDIFTVETADHARLQLQLSYNWYFDINKDDDSITFKLFQVPDFVGDACKSIASRVRGAVAQVKFDEFHRNSARIIRKAVFGTNENEKIKAELKFTANNLVITNIDIQTVEPVDVETLKSLQKSVQIAIKITTDAQEAAARHDAERIEQESKAKLETQSIIDKRNSELEKKNLLEIEIENQTIKITGQATSEAKAKAEADRISGESIVNLAKSEAEAAKIKYFEEIEQLKFKQQTELEYKEKYNQLEIEREQKLTEIRNNEFKNKIEQIGTDTIQAIAKAGPELQVKLLEALGLQSVLITDGNNPINLFNTGKGLIGNITTEN